MDIDSKTQKHEGLKPVPQASREMRATPSRDG